MVVPPAAQHPDHGGSNGSPALAARAKPHAPGGLTYAAWPLRRRTGSSSLGDRGGWASQDLAPFETLDVVREAVLALDLVDRDRWDAAESGLDPHQDECV